MEELGFGEEQRVRIGGEETIWNPLTQAELMNRSETELNILIGLCV